MYDRNCFFSQSSAGSNWNCQICFGSVQFGFWPLFRPKYKMSVSVVHYLGGPEQKKVRTFFSSSCRECFGLWWRIAVGWGFRRNSLRGHQRRAYRQPHLHQDCPQAQGLEEAISTPFNLRHDSIRSPVPSEVIRLKFLRGHTAVFSQFVFKKSLRQNFTFCAKVGGAVNNVGVFCS